MFFSGKLVCLIHKDCPGNDIAIKTTGDENGYGLVSLFECKLRCEDNKACKAYSFPLTSYASGLPGTCVFKSICDATKLVKSEASQMLCIGSKCTLIMY